MFRTIVLSIAMVSMAMLSFAQASKSQKPASITIGRTEALSSVYLGETRTLNIYLPEGYKATDTTRYDIIYLLDGGTDEDFLHITGLVQFSTMPWIQWLQPSIVVGIVNVDRKRDFTFPTTIKADKEKYPTTGSSEKFIAFIEKELQPYIRQQFRTTGSRMLIGQSLGGLLASDILLQKPALFNRYLIISPSLWWDNGSILKRATALNPQTPAGKTDVYIAVGKEGLTPTAEPHVMEVDANVLADKIKAIGNKNISLHFDYLPDENHATILHQAVLNAFRMSGK